MFNKNRFSLIETHLVPVGIFPGRYHYELGRSGGQSLHDFGPVELAYVSDEDAVDDEEVLARYRREADEKPDPATERISRGQQLQQQQSQQQAASQQSQSQPQPQPQQQQPQTVVNASNVPTNDGYDYLTDYPTESTVPTSSPSSTTVSSGEQGLVTPTLRLDKPETSTPIVSIYGKNSSTKEPVKFLSIIFKIQISAVTRHGSYDYIDKI